MDRKILTIVCEVTDSEAAKPIWDAMKGKDGRFLGCRPFCLAWGNLSDERDKYQAVADKAMESLRFETDRDYPETVETACGKKFFQWACNVYSTSEKNYDSGEWFANLDSLKEKYKVVKEDGEAVTGT